MAPNSDQTRHLRYGRFGRSESHSESGESPHGRRRGHWTGYQPLADAVTQARLEAMMERTEVDREDTR